MIMLLRTKITSLVNMELVIPELSARLPGKGSSCLVNTNSIPASETLRLFLSKRWVAITPLNEERFMPHWPFYDERKLDLDTSTTSTASSEDVPKVEQLLENIQKILQEISNKQSAPEVLATHIALQNARMGGINPGVVHVSGSIDDSPQFIPSNILPKTEIDVSIKPQTDELVKDDIDDAAKALKSLKKGKR